MLAAGGEGPFVMLWNPQNGSLIRIFTERPGKTFSLAFCGNDVLASGESDNMARLWDTATGQQIATLSGHTGTVSTMTFEPKTRSLVTGSFDASVRFWTLPRMEMTISPDGPVLLAVAPVHHDIPVPAVQEQVVNFPEEVLLPLSIIPETSAPQPPFGFFGGF
jgi:WD40 repeat protein